MDFAHTDYRWVGEVIICSQYAAALEHGEVEYDTYDKFPQEVS